MKKKKLPINNNPVKSGFGVPFAQDKRETNTKFKNRMIKAKAKNEVRKGLILFDIDGIEIYALNRANAVRKFAQMSN